MIGHPLPERPLLALNYKGEKKKRNWCQLSDILDIKTKKKSGKEVKIVLLHFLLAFFIQLCVVTLENQDIHL